MVARNLYIYIQLDQFQCMSSTLNQFQMEYLPISLMRERLSREKYALMNLKITTLTINLTLQNDFLGLKLPMMNWILTDSFYFIIYVSFIYLFDYLSLV